MAHWNDRYVILKGMRNDRYYIADPAQGQRAWTQQELAGCWSGNVLIVGPPDYMHR